MLDLGDEKMTMRPPESSRHSEILRNTKCPWYRTARKLPCNWRKKAVRLESSSGKLGAVDMRVDYGKQGQ